MASSNGGDAANRIVQKLWSYCNVLRDDGLSYQDYLEQLTFLLFLKMADERARLTGEEQPIPEGYRWADLAAPQMEGVELEQHYRETLRVLGEWTRPTPLPVIGYRDSCRTAGSCSVSPRRSSVFCLRHS